MLPLAQLKAELKIDYVDDDFVLAGLRDAAVALIERRTQSRLYPFTDTARLSAWEPTVLPMAPVQSVESITYTASGSTVTMPSADYYLDQTDAMPVLRFIDEPEMDEHTSALVTYRTGYDAIPAPLERCIVALVGAWYNNPEASQPIALQTVPLSVEFILDWYTTGSRIR